MTVVTLASIGKPFAVKGWQILNSWTQPSEQIFTYTKHLQITDDVISTSPQWSDCLIAEMDIHGERFLIRLQGVTSPEQASIYTGRNLGVERHHLPPIDDGYYWHDLIGLQVFHQDQDTGTRHDYGQVRALTSAGGQHDILEVVDSKGVSRLIPFIDEVYIRRIDLDQCVIEVFWPPDY